MTILTSANGSLPLTLRKGETLVIRNYSGAETVTGSTVPVQFTKDGADVYGPQLTDASVSLSSSGSLDYQVVQGKVGGDAINERGRLVFAAFGHSFLRNGWRYEAPWSYTQGGSITGVYAEGLEQLVSASTQTLTIDTAAQTIQFAGGVPVRLRAGYVRVPGPTGLYDGVHIRVNLPQVVSGSMTLTRSGTRGDEIYGADNPLVWAQIFSRQSVQFVNYAASGQTMWAMAGENGSVAADISSLPPNLSGIVFDCNTNDVQSNRTLAQMQADAIDILNRLMAVGVPVYVTADPPFRSEWNADSAKRQTAAAYAMWLQSYCATLPRAVFVPMWDSMIPASGTSIRTAFAATDLVHPGGAAGQLAGYALWRAMGSPIDRGPNFGSSDSANSATNPNGSYLVTPYLNGSNALTGTGYSGNFANNVTPSVNNSTLVGAKVARTDGIAGEWEEATFTSTADGGNVILQDGTAAFVAGRFPAAYSRVQLFCEIEVQGSQLAPDARTAITAPSVRYARSTVNSNNAGPLAMTTYSGVLATAPLLILPTDTQMQLQRYGVGTATTSGAKVRWGRQVLVTV